MIRKIDSTPPIYFYLDPYQVPIDNLPKNTQSYWQWLCAQNSIPPMQGGGNIWTLQTYLYLKEFGFPCELVTTMPNEGIVLTHRDFLDASFQPNSKLLLVCLRADVDRHPYAQLHIVQNPYQTINKSPISLWESYFIPHWHQASLIPRDPRRGDTFENVTFIGNEVNLVPEFRDSSWYEQLDNLGLKFQQKLSHNEWHNYSSIDVILAIRSFGRENYWRGKPASKLYNAWHAGIPAILGFETAFKAEQKRDLDYLEATSLTEVINALKLLKNNPEMRQAMAKNGLVRAKETQPDMMITRWTDFLLEVAVPRYKKWRSMPAWQQQIFFKMRESSFALRPSYYYLRSQVLKLIN
jgi:hypothetical protein